MDNGRRLSNDSLAATHAAALYAYTLEQPGLYKTLNFNMFTPGDQADTNLKRFRDYIKHTTTAANALPNFVGMTYRGTERIFKQSLYKPGDRITWQAFSSSSRSQLAASDFVTTLPGHKLSGSLFILQVNAAKKIESFSAIPEEQVSPPPSRVPHYRYVMGRSCAFFVGRRSSFCQTRSSRCYGALSPRPRKWMRWTT